MQSIWCALVVAAVLASNGTASAQEKARVTVRVDDKAGVQGALLKFAKARASEVFGMSGIEVEWIAGKDANRLNVATPFTILIMAAAPAKLKAAMEHVGVDVMGQ